MNYPSKRAYYENENNNNAKEACYAIGHADAIYTKDDESETLGTKITEIETNIETSSNKIGDLSGSGLTETDLATAIKNDRAQLSENTQNLVQLSNPNLLINGDFQVWQRGTTIGDIYNQYSADRWYCSKSANAHSFTQVANGMQVIRTATGSTYVEQFAEFPKYKDSVMTLSTSINGVIYTVSGVPSSNSNSGITASTAVGVINIAFDATRSVVKVTIRIDDVTATINWAKLELGSIATPFVPRLYAEELALCQRYFVNLNLYNNSYAFFGYGIYTSGSTSARVNITVPITMRVLPSPTMKGSISVNTGSTNVVTSLSSDQISTNVIRLIMNLTSAPTSSGICEVMVSVSTSSLWLDSEIY